MDTTGFHIPFITRRGFDSTQLKGDYPHLDQTIPRRAWRGVLWVEMSGPRLPYVSPQRHTTPITICIPRPRNDRGPMDGDDLAYDAPTRSDPGQPNQFEMLVIQCSSQETLSPHPDG